MLGFLTQLFQQALPLVAVYDNDFMNSEWVKFLPKGHVALRNVLFAPLVIEGRAVGLMGLANKKTDFNDEVRREIRENAPTRK